MNTLERALARSEQSYQLCRSKAVVNAGRLFSTGPAGVYASSPSLQLGQEQLTHNKNWVFAAVHAIAKRVAAQRICVGLEVAKPAKSKTYHENLQPLDNHPLLDQLANPSELLTQWGLVYAMTSSLLLTGRTNVLLADEGIFYIPSFWATPADGYRATWKVRPNGTLGTAEIFVDSEHMLYAFLPDPADPWGVKSPLQATAMAVGVDEHILNAQYSSFRNGIFPSHMIRVGTVNGYEETDNLPLLDPHQREEIITAVKRMYAGLNHGQPMIADALIAGIEKLTMSPQEMDFMESGDSVKARILQTFGVNDIILGSTQNANRAQSYVAESNFNCNVINPIIRLLSDAFTQWVGKPWGVQVWLEPAVANDDEMKLKSWGEAARLGFITCNEYRRNILNLEDMAGGDQVFPSSMMSGQPNEEDVADNEDETEG